jgi:hypothetical protein
MATSISWAGSTGRAMICAAGDEGCDAWDGNLAVCYAHRRLWVAAFRPEDRSRVEAVLMTVCDAFFIPLCYRFRIRPSNEIHVFYRCDLCGAWADSLEYVCLAIDLEHEFGVCPEVVDGLLSTETCTVGDLVRLVAGPQQVLTVMRSA